jgi:hypothetical protein
VHAYEALIGQMVPEDPAHTVDVAMRVLDTVLALLNIPKVRHYES